MKKAENIGEQLLIRDEYFVLARALYQQLSGVSNLQKKVIAIGGESGCGKSTTAICLERELAKNGVPCSTLHMDSYFKLPPKDNHQNRVLSLENVGPQELNMELLNMHTRAFKDGVDSIVIPVVSYEENCFAEKELDLSNTQVLLVEGVYSFLLENVDRKIFLSRTYHDTKHNRLKRTREKHNPLTELILEIEHKIVAPQINEADYIINKDYSLA